MKPIPIKSAKEISKEFEVPEVVIFGYDPQTGKQHVTTYGKTIDQCKDAARAGNYLKKALGWPAELCNAEPSRAKKQQDELTRLRAEVKRLRGEDRKVPLTQDCNICARNKKCNRTVRCADYKPEPPRGENGENMEQEVMDDQITLED